jgi:hypothetical protein
MWHPARVETQRASHYYAKFLLQNCRYKKLLAGIPVPKHPLQAACETDVANAVCYMLAFKFRRSSHQPLPIPTVRDPV